MMRSSPMMMDTPIERMNQTVTLVSATPDAEKHMAYCARVSNPNNQENEKFSGLLKYCVKHQHWSIFEQAFHDSGNKYYQRTGSFKYCAIARSHIKNFHKGMLILPYSRRRSPYQNSVGRTPRIVKILLMMLTHLRCRSLKC